MHDPKFRFGDDDSIYHRDDAVAVPADEPVILLRGKDQVTVAALEEYIRVMRLFPDSANACAHADSAQERLDTIRAWQEANPSRVGMGCGMRETVQDRELLTW